MLQGAHYSQGMRSRSSLPEFSALLVLCLAMAAFAPGCALGNDDSEVGQGPVIVYGLPVQPAGLDPHLHPGHVTAIPLRQVYDTLLYRHPLSRDVVPGLAREWSLSDDGRVLHLLLREDVVFHDGTSLNAAAVAANLARILSSDADDADLAALRRRFERLRIVDDYRIEIILRQPWSPLANALTRPAFAIAGAQALEEWSAARYQFHQVGSGPFRLEEYTPGRRILLRRNPHHAWGPEVRQDGAGDAIDAIEFRFFTSAGARSQALRAQEVQVMGGLQPDEVPAVEAADGYRTVFVPVPGQPLQFMFNTIRYPTTLRGLRQALIFLSNRNAIAVEDGRPVAPVAWGPLAESTLFSYTGLRGLYAQDRQQAEALLAAAGIRDADEDGWLEIDGASLQLDLLLPADPALLRAAGLLSEQWRAAGIRTRLISAPTALALREAVAQGDYHLVAQAAAGYDPGWLYDHFANDGALNWSHVRDEELDALLRDALATSDERLRFGLYARAQQIIMDLALILPLREQVNIVAVDERLQGLAWDATGLIPWLKGLAWRAS